MIKESIFKILMIAVCACLFVGCEKEEVIETSKGTTNNPLTSIDNFSGENETGTFDGNQLLELATIDGDVTEFSKTGCTLNPQISEDGGQISKIAAAGSENSSTNVMIHYQDDCIFQLVTIHSTTGKAEVTNATLSDIKKQTKLLIFGEYQDKQNITATKVMIKRIE